MPAAAMEQQGIKDFFAGRHILVTGATGFMGKVLVEKLIRSCPDLAGIYILVRTKRGKDPQERLKKIVDLPLFDLVREQTLRKVTVVPGDLKLKGLGLTPAWVEELCANVSVVFHSAATVRFNDPLKDSVLLNTRGTAELVDLAMRMHQLKVFLHVSTTYCNVDRVEIDEVVYPPHADWREVVRVVENADEDALKVLTPKYIAGSRGLPNTYTFAKSLAEHVINDHADRIPCVICRPSIVISSDSEPVAGWVDNFNGPVALLVGAGTGIVHSTLADKNIVADYMPVDVAIKAIIVAAWKKAQEPPQEQRKVTVYNAASSEVKPITMGQMVEMGLELMAEYSLSKIVWMPAGFVTTNFYLYYMFFIISHVIPAIVADIGLKIAGQKFSLLKIQRKIYTANTALSYFTTRTWKIKNAGTLALDAEVPQDERDAFAFAIVDRDPRDFFAVAMLGGRKYLLGDTDENLPAARLRYKRVRYIVETTKVLFYAWLIYMLYNSSLSAAVVSYFTGMLSD